MDEDGRRTKRIREQALQLTDLREVVEHDVGIGRIHLQKVLVIILGRVERLAGLDSGHDPPAEDFRIVQLRDVALRDAFLLRRCL